MKRPLLIFLIDDDFDDQEIFSSIMKEIQPDIQCVFASDGVFALEKLHDTAFRPDIIFLDVNMPRMNGIQCLAEIRKIKRLDNIQVYMYSTSADPAMVLLCKKLGANAFIKKHTDNTAASNDFRKIIDEVNASR